MAAVMPSTAKPVISCQLPPMSTPELASNVRASERRMFMPNASTGARTMSNTRAHGRRTSVAEKNTAATTQERRLRTPLHASSTPTLVWASWMMLPEVVAATPSKCSEWSTMSVTQNWSCSVSREYVPGGMGAHIGHRATATSEAQLSGMTRVVENHRSAAKSRADNARESERPTNGCVHSTVAA